MKNELARPGGLRSVSGVLPLENTRDWTWTYVLLSTLGLMTSAVVPLARFQAEFALTLMALVAVGLAGFGWYLTRETNIADERIRNFNALEHNQREITGLERREEQVVLATTLGRSH